MEDHFLRLSMNVHETNNIPGDSVQAAGLTGKYIKAVEYFSSCQLSVYKTP